MHVGMIRKTWTHLQSFRMERVIGSVYAWVSVRLDLYICKLEHRYVAVYLLLTPPPDKTLLRFMSELISSPQSRATYNND